MIQCEKCETWQHVVCLGFESPEDPRIPETYHCYACQLKVSRRKEPPTTEVMARITG